MKETIDNVKYLQDKADKVKYYVICKTDKCTFWNIGQIVGKFKSSEQAAGFKKKNLFSDYLAIKDIESIISSRIHK